MTGERARDVDYMIRTTGELLRENIGMALAAVAILAAVDVAQDRIPEFSKAATLPRVLASLVFQYQVTLNALVGRGYTDRSGRARFWGLLGLSIVSGIGILLGFVALVIPGIYLLIRWSVSVPVLVGESAGVFESLTRSGEEIRGRFWPVLGFCLMFWVALVASAVAAALLDRDGTLFGSVLLNLLLNGVLVTYWLAAVAVYTAGRPPRDIADVFA